MDRFKCKISLNRKMKHWSFTMSTQVSVYNVRDRISPYGHTTFHILDKSGAFQEEAEMSLLLGHNSRSPSWVLLVVSG